MSRLVLLQGGQVTPYPLATGETVLGRLPECAIHLPSNVVSRRHARVIHDGGSYFLEDLGSGNGTFLNGQRLTERAPLKDGDRIKIGTLLLRFESESAARPHPRPWGVDFTSDEDDGSTIVSSSAAGSGFGSLDERPEAKLKAVLEISRALAGTLEIESLLPKILESLLQIFPHADRGCILLKEDSTGEMAPRATRHRNHEGDGSIRLSRTVVNKVLEEKQGILSADASHDSQFQGSTSIANLSIRSMICAPMLNVDGEPVGLINLDTQTASQRFGKDDLELLLAVAGQAALSYEAARLLASHMQKQKQDSELEIARGVQQALLPEELPKVPGYEFYASYDSAQAVGGDYYDAMMLDDHTICLAFGDVAGKGVPGALIMSRLSSCVQNTMAFVHDVGQAMAAINNHMCANAVEGRFVTFVLVVINLETHEMALSNGGHMSPMILKTDGTIEEFPDDVVGLPVGVVEDYPFDVVRRVIAPDETIVLFTDGVDEAMNPEGDLYTLERMREFLRTGPRQAEALGRALLADVRRHANGRPQNDDITIMTIGRNPAPSDE